MDAMDRKCVDLKASIAASSAGIPIDDAELVAWQSFCRVLLSSNEFFYVE